MKIETILAAISVGDIESAIAWYGKLFGRDIDDRPMKEAAEWRLANGGGVQLVLDPKRAGQSMVTIGVRDLEATVTGIKRRGIDPQNRSATGPYAIAQVTDPDGNVLTFAQPKEQ